MSYEGGFHLRHEGELTGAVQVSGSGEDVQLTVSTVVATGTSLTTLRLEPAEAYELAAALTFAGNATRRSLAGETNGGR